MTVTAKPSTGSTDTGRLAAREDLVTLTIDDVEVSVPKGTLVIRAAELIGVAIPRFCDHPLLDPVGACRQCLVEVPDAGNGRGIPKPQASCTLEVAQGMVVKTQVSSPVADKAQHGNMEFLLINHPLDCPICDKGGECPLQNQAMSNGYGESRFTDVKRTYPKPVAISANVLLDRERCVLCARCTRFSEQVAGDPFISLIERGALQQVGIYEREPFQSYFSGNTIQICPVGALTSAEYRFRSRPFDLVSTPSVSEHDACGSAIRVDHRRGKVMRRQAGDDPEVNEEWITDKDRFAFAYGRGEDRLTRPLVREDGVLRPASWPEALDVAAEGLEKAVAGTRGEKVGVLVGGRLTLEDAYAYSKFARGVLGTNSIDFRARPHSAEEADFLAAAVAGTGRGVTYGDLETASSVLLVCLEPEEEAGAIFLRLRKAWRKQGLASWTLAPYRSRGAAKAGTTLVPTVPGAEAAWLDSWSAATGVALDAGSVLLVGERAAGLSGTLSAVLRLADRTGARVAWVPRRAGDRGAVEAGCLPNLLPGGRPVADPSARVDVASTWGIGSMPRHEGSDGDEMLVSAADGELAALVVGGVDPTDLADPAASLDGLERARFVVSLETRASLVTERADVVLPVSLMTERSGTFVDWEGRRRPFPAVLDAPNAMSDLRVLAALADALGRPLGFRKPEAALAELDELGPWEGARAAVPAFGPGEPARPGRDELVVATWRMGLDDSRALANEPYLAATARPAVARLSPATAAAHGVEVGADGLVEADVTLTNDRGELTLPLVVEPGMVDGAVWVPAKAPGRSVAEHLAVLPGDLVAVTVEPHVVEAAPRRAMPTDPITDPAVDDQGEGRAHRRDGDTGREAAS
ncbi:NADH-quinone oxidoreductase subunit G [Microlunatus flavus]|uniref:NADH-quinone oxidoreductase n=1 Tax=Microlunatus flavus TaxID=1036181 RepID=A0A1H9LWU9_9ACTN|nr:NADH-quinone oxidoreductase subunit G [Microlunatus flavus]SER15828.1 NADH-quinone oxidoreductase subunit G [Microlunatus flavus]